MLSPIITSEKNDIRNTMVTSKIYIRINTFAS